MALPPPSDSSTCLVTGASSGIGEEIARELARRGHGVTLAARRESRLRELADELTDTGVRAEVVVCDVTEPSSRQDLIDAIADFGLTVEVLVNNAGFGSGGLFHELDADTEVTMVRTNVEAVVAFCGEYLPQMVERGRGAILNLGSIAGYQPLPRQATYSASKAFVVSFTDALWAELQGTGVTATSLCPGPVRTEFGDVAGINEELFSLPSIAIKSPAEVARAAVNAMDRGRRTVAPGIANAAGALAGHYTPRSVLLPLFGRFYPVGR